MPLLAGARVGPYEILSAIGAGGMGEVYRARDTRLNRDVAIKALPELFSLDPERVARFEREAQLLAALSHPNIGAIHGLEESHGERYLILELIPGESLAQRIASGPVPLNEALGIARQIAEALEAAHEKGIVHRDLKPGNVMLTPEGQVKVLDFGLAKAMDAGNSSSSANPTGLQHSPTFTSPAMTAVGLVLGTAAYMAPEQAKGRVADKRSDVWAFGCVLYELLTGTNAFAGEDVSDTLAAVLRGEPDWTRLPKDTPPPIERLVRRCLQKDRKQRIPDISVARFEIDEWLSGRSAATAVSAAPRVRRWRTALMVSAGVIAGVAAAGALALISWPRPASPTVARFEVKPPAATRVLLTPIGAGIDVAVSADGSRVVYGVRTGAGQALALRRLDETESTLLPGTALSQSFSLSPDGMRLAFLSGGKLQVLLLGASAPQVVCNLGGGVLGTTWLSNDTIVFARHGLFRVPAGGGTPEVIAEPEPDATYGFPAVVPGGRGLIYTVDKRGQRHLAARALPSGEHKVFAENATFARYVGSDHLVFLQGGQLVAARFDPSRMMLDGAPSPLDDLIVDKLSGGASFDVSANGTFVSVSGSAMLYQSRFILKTRDGSVSGAVGSVDLDYPRYPRISPDGRRLAATIGPASRGHLWVFDLAGTAQPLKLTFTEHNLWPAWTDNGKTLLFTRIVNSHDQREISVRQGIMTMPSDGSTLSPRMVVKVPDGSTSLSAASPDGRWLLYTANAPGTGTDLIVKPLDKDGEERPWLAEPFHEREAAFSPDGKWVAFVSTQTGGPEVWVRPFPGPGAPIRVSPSGGREPVWARNAKELFYQQGAKLMAAAVTTASPELRFALPRVLFEGGFVSFQDGTPRTYDVTPDGRFLMIEDKPNPTPAVLTVVIGWRAMLAARVPALK